MEQGLASDEMPSHIRLSMSSTLTMKFLCRKANQRSMCPSLVCSVEDIRCSSRRCGRYDYRATLYLDCATITVPFNTAQRDTMFKKGVCVLLPGSRRLVPVMV